MDVTVLVDGLGLLCLHILNDLHPDVHVGLARAEPDVAEDDVELDKGEALLDLQATAESWRSLGRHFNLPDVQIVALGEDEIFRPTNYG